MVKCQTVSLAARKVLAQRHLLCSAPARSGIVFQECLAVTETAEDIGAPENIQTAPPTSTRPQAMAGGRTKAACASPALLGQQTHPSQVPLGITGGVSSPLST